MFRIVVYVEDNKLAGVLHRLVGFGSKPPEVTPVANPEDVKPKANGHAPATKGTLDGFVKTLRAMKVTINAESAREAASKSGGSATAYSYYLRQAIKHGLIKQKGSGTNCTYEWRS